MDSEHWACPSQVGVVGSAPNWEVDFLGLAVVDFATNSPTNSWRAAQELFLPHMRPLEKTSLRPKRMGWRCIDLDRKASPLRPGMR